MRRLWLIGLAVVGLALAGGIAYAATTSGNTPAPATRVVRVSHYYKVGPEASCDGDACGIGVVSPIEFSLPSTAARFRATITVSLEYHASPGRFPFAVSLRDADGSRVTVRPPNRRLAPDHPLGATTLVFSAAGLRPGVLYQLKIGTGIGVTVGGRAAISTKHVLVVMEAVPG